MNILATFFVLGFLIFFHELGHFLIAKLFKVHIDTFSIGFGPPLFKLNKNNTLYKLCIIPVGGYVKMKTDDYTDQTESTITQDTDSFNSKKWWQKSLIVFAGPAFNLILATILIIFSFLWGRTYTDLQPIIDSVDYPYSEFFDSGDIILEVNNKTVRSYSEIFTHIVENQDNVFLVQKNVGNSPPSSVGNAFIRSEFSTCPASPTPPTNCQLSTVNFQLFNRQEFYNALSPMTTNIVGDVNPGLPAWRAGVKPGDRIIQIDGVETNTWTEVRDGIAFSSNDSIVLTVLRDSNTYDLIVQPEINPLVGENAKIIGITQQLDIIFSERYGIIDSIHYGVLTTVNFVYLNYNALFTLAKNPASFKNNVGGPIMVYYMASQTTKKGFADTLLFMATISILLMIMNLLPIPVFDGGLIMFFLYEGVVGKQIPIKIQAILQQIGILFLISLMIYTFYSDITRFFL